MVHPEKVFGKGKGSLFIYTLYDWAVLIFLKLNVFFPHLFFSLFLWVWKIPARSRAVGRFVLLLIVNKDYVYFGLWALMDSSELGTFNWGHYFRNRVQMKYLVYSGLICFFNKIKIKQAAFWWHFSFISNYTKVMFIIFLQMTRSWNTIIVLVIFFSSSLVSNNAAPASKPTGKLFEIKNIKP